MEIVGAVAAALHASGAADPMARFLRNHFTGNSGKVVEIVFHGGLDTDTTLDNEEVSRKG